jgi:hypothetical protein
LDPLGNMPNKLLRPVDRSMVKQDLRALRKLLTKLLKTFDDGRCVNLPFDHIGYQLIGTFQKASHIQPATMTRSRDRNDCT